MLDNTYRARSHRSHHGLTCAAACLAGSLTTHAALAAAQDSPLPAGNHYELVSSDEFDGSELDRTKWCTRLAFGGGAPLQVKDADCLGPGGYGGTGNFLKDEQQRYVDMNTDGETMHVVSDGTLKLRASKTRRDDTWASYESALIRSKYLILPTADAKYYVTTRVRLPNVRGTFTAMWLAPGFFPDGRLVWPPEIDTFEGALNEKEDRADMLRMGGVYVRGPQTASTKQEISYALDGYDMKWNNYFSPSSLRDVWVEIGVEWSVESACTYLDGKLIVCQNYRWVTETGDAGAPASLVMNLAVGGEWAGRHGIADNLFPTAMELDYVRVFRDGNGTVTPPPPAAGGTGGSDGAAGSGANAGTTGTGGAPSAAGTGSDAGQNGDLDARTPPAGDLWGFFGRYFIKRN